MKIAPRPPTIHKKTFPFLRLSAEIRNQIYLDIIGPQLPRPQRLEQCPHRSWFQILVEEKFWPDRTFNTAFFVLNHQIHHEFSHILWKVLSVEWKVDNFDLNLRELSFFTSMTRLQRCKLILNSGPGLSTELGARPVFRSWYGRRDATAFELDVELTVFGLAHKLSRMPHLDEIYVEYDETESGFDQDYFVRYCDGSLIHFTGPDLKFVLGDDLRAMKNLL